MGDRNKYGLNREEHDRIVAEAEELYRQAESVVIGNRDSFDRRERDPRGFLDPRNVLIY